MLLCLSGGAKGYPRKKEEILCFNFWLGPRQNGLFTRNLVTDNLLSKKYEQKKYA